MPLIVDTDCPYGNASDIAVSETETTPEVSFAADPHGGPECLWFCFRVQRTGPADQPCPQQFRLVLKHPQNMLGASDAAALRPVIKRPGSDWERLGPGVAEPLPDGRCNIVWETNPPEPLLEVAFCYPYGRSELDLLLAETDGYWHDDVIGVSQEARPIIRLANDYGEPDGQRPGVYLVARQHSSETPGSWVLDGLFRYMASLGEAAPLVWAVPLTNIDGVENGDYGKDNFPYDLNRAWGVVPMRHETLVIRRDLLRWRERCKPMLAIDFHAPGGCETYGIYCFRGQGANESEEVRTATQEWSDIIEATLGEQYAADDFCRIATYASRWETPRFAEYCAETLAIPALSTETPYAMVGDKVLEVPDYREAGRRIGQAIVQKLQERAST